MAAETQSDCLARVHWMVRDSQQLQGSYLEKMEMVINKLRSLEPYCPLSTISKRKSYSCETNAVSQRNCLV